MKFELISKDDVYDHVDKPYNVPLFDNGFTEDDFSSEWWQVRNGLMDILKQFGENDAFGDKDFHLGETLTSSRGIGVSITSDNMVTPLLLEQTRWFLLKLDHDYEINYQFETEDGTHDIFINRVSARGDCPVELFEAFGLSTD